MRSDQNRLPRDETTTSTQEDGMTEFAIAGDTLSIRAVWRQGTRLALEPAGARA